MNQYPLNRVVIRGYKSIRECDLTLGRINVLIGANGSGKSNFLGFFRMFRQMVDGGLQLHVARQGGPDSLLHFGRKRTPQLHAELTFGQMTHSFTLEPTADGRLVFLDECTQDPDWFGEPYTFGEGHFESWINGGGNIPRAHGPLVYELGQCHLYHFDDMGESGRIRQRHGIHLNDHLYADGSNLAAYLYLLQQKHPQDYWRIVKTIQLAAPFFAMFFLRPHPENPEFIDLEWMEIGNERPMKAHQLSDGTLRFACLVTLLMQPREYLPPIIWIDEPELGLHPAAIALLGAMLRSAAVDSQVICSTQSVELINEFDVEELVVVERKDGASVFKRFQQDQFKDWLTDYSLGELWLKNLLGGRP